MNRALSAIVALFAAAILQVGLAPYIVIGGTSPNFLLIVVVVMALTTGSDEGATVGFVAGLVFDLIGAGPVGAMALVFTLVGFVAGLLNQHLFAGGWLLPVSVLGIASLLSEFLYLLLVLVLGGSVSFWDAILVRVIPGTLYTTLVAVMVFPLLSRFLREDRNVATFKRVA